MDQTSIGVEKIYSSKHLKPAFNSSCGTTRCVVKKRVHQERIGLLLHSYGKNQRDDEADRSTVRVFLGLMLLEHVGLGVGLVAEKLYIKQEALQLRWLEGSSQTSASIVTSRQWW